MDPLTTQLVITGIIEVLMVPIIVFVLKHFVGKRLDDFDGKREEARMARAEADRRATKQREAERTLILAMTRTMLLDNYEKCIDKGCYTVEEREVYHTLYEAYKDDGGNSVIDEIAPRIRRLPLEPPKKQGDNRPFKEA